MPIPGLGKKFSGEDLEGSGAYDILTYDKETGEYVVVDIKNYAEDPRNNPEKIGRFRLQTGLYAAALNELGEDAGLTEGSKRVTR